MKNSHQSIRFCHWCTALCVQLYFPHGWDGNYVPVSGISMPADTMFCSQSKQNVLHTLSPDRKRLATTTFFFPWICLQVEFHCWQTRLPPIKAIPTRREFEQYPVNDKNSSSTLFFLEDNFLGLYFCIKFQIET